MDNPSFVYGTFYCSGSEQSLMTCSNSYSTLLNCQNNEVAGVHCVGKYFNNFKNFNMTKFGVKIFLHLATCTDGDIRLGNGAVLRGRVEVCINGTWGTICDHHWTKQEASVACSHLGYSPYGR